MAADDTGERTEQPTQRRREEARSEGQVARSQDLTAATALLVALILLNIFAPSMYRGFLEMLHECLDVSDAPLDAVPIWIARIVHLVAAMLLPFLLLLLALSAAGSMAQSGLLLTPKKLMPKLENLSFKRGLKRVFSLDSLTRTGMGLFKMLAVAAVAYYTITSRMEPVLGVATIGVAGILHMASELLFALMLRLALVLLVLAIVDYVYQRYRIESQLKMTKQEIKDELKRMEGDPVVKSRRRQVQHKLAMQRLAVDVPKADVVVTNPTEYAVALRYDEETMAAPKVIAKGKDLLALRIRQIAQHHRIPVIQRPPLARGLFAACDVGDTIPSTYYRAVAEVLAYVYQLSHRVA